MKQLFLALTLFCAAQVSLAQNPIPNANMELWDDGPHLNSWITNSHPMTLPPWDPYIVRQDAEHINGNYSACFYGNGMFHSWGTVTFPVSDHPHSLRFWGKVAFPACVNDNGWSETDTVFMDIEVFHNGTVVDAGHWQSTANTNFQFQQFNIPISQNDTLADSCRITITGCKLFGGCGFVPAGGEFKVDKLHLLLNSCVDSSLICQPGSLCCDAPLFLPVCGCDGETYDNACVASYFFGITSAVEGDCNAQGGGACTNTGVVVNGVECLLILDSASGTLFMPCSGWMGQSVAAGDTIHYNYVLNNCISFCMQGQGVDLTCLELVNPPAACTNAGIVVNGVECLLIQDSVTGMLFMPCNGWMGQTVNAGDTVHFNYVINNCASFCMQGQGVDLTCLEIWGGTIGCTFEVVASGTNPTSFLANNGSAQAFILTGGSAPFFYDWSNGTSGIGLDTLTNIGVGTYCVTVTDANSCVDSVCVTLTGDSACIDSALICAEPFLCCDFVPFDPVCGCDSVTYDNSCLAQSIAGVTAWTTGPCTTSAVDKTQRDANTLFLSPNPAAEKVQVVYDLKKASAVSLRVLNVIGQTVLSTETAFQAEGRTHIYIDVRALPLGIYLLEMKTDSGERRLRKFVRQ